MTRRAVVTGAAGFIGSTLTDRLLSDGWEVVGIDSFEDYYSRELKEANLRSAQRLDAFTLLEKNLLDLAREDAVAEAIRSALRNSDAVFHLAAQAGVRASWGSTFRVYAENNVLATQLLLEACLQADVRAFIYASSSSVYGDAARLPMREDAECRPHSPYGVTKLAGEHLCRLYARNFDMPTCSLRFFTVYGPRQRPDMGFNRFIRAALENRPIHVYGDGKQSRDFTYIDDIVEGIIAATAAPLGSVYNLGGGSRVGLLEVLDTLSEIIGRTLTLEHAIAQSGDVRDTSADLELAGAELGYAPRVGLREGIEKEVEWVAHS